MKYRIIGLALTTIASLAPAVSQASSEEDALNSCVRAFAASLGAPGAAAAPAYKVEYRGNLYLQSTTDVYSRGYTFHLLAKGKTGSPMAQARCATDFRGTVITLSPLPAQAALPVLAAQ